MTHTRRYNHLQLFADDGPYEDEWNFMVQMCYAPHLTELSSEVFEHYRYSTIWIDVQADLVNAWFGCEGGLHHFHEAFGQVIEMAAPPIDWETCDWETVLLDDGLEITIMEEQQ